MHVLMISLDKSLATQPEGESVQRHLEYAERAGRLTIVTYSPRLPLPAGVDGAIHPSPQLTIIPTNSFSRLTYPLDAYRLGLRAASVDLITTQDPFVTGLVGWRLRGRLRAPLLVQNHSHFFGNQAWLAERPIRYRLFSRLGEFVVRRADMYRTVNQREREAYLALGGSPEWVAVLPVMTASEKFAAPVAANMLQKIRDSLGLQPQHKVIVWVGRPIKTKRVPLMLQVFKQVVEQAPDARLLLVGDMAICLPMLHWRRCSLSHRPMRECRACWARLLLLDCRWWAWTARRAWPSLFRTARMAMCAAMAMYRAWPSNC
jgi:glycosyltransferase involved in cell wall biosynthesis